MTSDAGTGNTASRDSPNAMGGSSLNGAEGTGGPVAPDSTTPRGTENDDEARQRAQQILEEGLPKMTGALACLLACFRALTIEAVSDSSVMR